MTHTQETTAPAPKIRNAQATHDRLVRSALDLFTSQGYHGTTTPEIAARAGVAEGTIYRHFASKQQLLNDIYGAAARRLSAAIQATPPTLSCSERLGQIAAAWRDVAMKEPAVVRLLFVSRLRALLDQPSRDAQSEVRDGLERVIATGKAQGQVRPGPADLWADVWLQLITLMLERVANREWTTEHTGPQQVVQSAWRAIAMRAEE